MAIGGVGAIAALVLPEIGKIALPFLAKLWKNSPEWIDVIQAAVEGVPDAVRVIKNLINGWEKGREWTPDELRASLLEARGLHDAIQATGRPTLNKK